MLKKQIPSLPCTLLGGVHVGVCDGKIVVCMSRMIKAILLNYISATLLNSMTKRL